MSSDPASGFTMSAHRSSPNRSATTPRANANSSTSLTVTG